MPNSPHAPVGLSGAGQRDLRLDACRGLALWFIFIDHIPGNSLAWLTLRNYGFSDATEVFVFVSGYTCMLAYGGALREQGWPTIVARALRRALEIYAVFLLLLIAYFIAIWVAGHGSRYLDATNTRFFFDGPGTALLHAAMLQYAPVNTDILPTFVLLHLSFPAVLWLLLHRSALALAISVMLYLMVQIFSWHVPAWPTGELYFNPLAWQILFVLGAWYADDGALRLETIVQSRVAIVLAVLYLAVSLAFALSWEIKQLETFIPDSISQLIYPIYKSHLAPVRLIHFLALALVVSRLMPAEGPGLTKTSIMAIIRCGENSLAVYCLGVVLSFLGFVILSELSSTITMQIVITIAGIALLVIAANLMTWTSQHDRPGPKLF